MTRADVLMLAVLAVVLALFVAWRLDVATVPQLELPADPFTTITGALEGATTEG
jgi:hypothetical protein